MKHVFKKQPSPIAVAVATAVAMSCIGSSAFAQEGTPTRIEEVIIQAERRDTTESTTAISMEVLTGNDLAESQVVGFEDLQNEVPNLQFNTNGFGWAQANVRGVGNASGGGPFEQVGVPIIIDGGAQGEEISLGGSLLDVGTVQVLRGPQGTFIGQSAAGGAIVVASARPNFDGVNGFIEGQLGGYDMERLTGAVNLPISDTIAARISFLSSNQGSFYTNESSGWTISGDKNDVGSSTDRQFRLGVLWTPNDRFAAYLKLETTDQRYIGNPSTPSNRPYTGYRDHDSNPLTPSVPVTTYSQYAIGPNGEEYAPNEPFRISHPYALAASQENLRATVDLSYTLNNGITVNSVTNWTEFYGVNGIAPNRLAWGGTGDNFAFLYGPGNYTINHEFTALSPDDQRLTWLVGTSWNKRFTEFEWSGDFGNSQTCGWQFDGTWSACQILPPAATTTFFYDVQETTVEDLGIFFQMDFDLTDSLELSFGGRYNRNDVNNVERFLFPATLGLNATTGVLCGGQGARRGLYCPLEPKSWKAPGATQREFKGETPTYRIGLNWEPFDNQFFYAFYSRGYKAGQPTQVNINTGVPLPTATPIVEEIVDDYEIGWKGTLLDGALYAELGYFYQDYQDMQLAGGYVTSATRSGGGTANIGGAEIEGFEGSLRTNIGGLNIRGSFGYTKSDLTGISTYETRAFQQLLSALYPSTPGQEQNIGDTSKGCVANAPTQYCFDFSPYALTIQGAEMLNSPKLSYNLSVDYPFSLSNGSLLTPRLSYRHTDENYSSILQSTTDKYYVRDEVDTLDLSITYTQDDWVVQGFVNNLTDEVYVTSTGGSVLYGDPRLAGVRIRMSY